MTRKNKFDTRELGLILGDQLLGVEDLHFGLWDDALEPTLQNLPTAQKRYTEVLLSRLPKPSAKTPVRVLDVGCGTGPVLEQMLRRGYRVDGVSPSKWLSERIRQRLQNYPQADVRLFECRFEDMPIAEVAGQYDVVLFCESFQYLDIAKALKNAQGLLKPGGLIVISDYFKDDASGRARPEEREVFGGHSLRAFYGSIAALPFELVRDEDITARASPTATVFHDLLNDRIKPAAITLGQYFSTSYPKLSWLLARLFHKKFNRVRDRYFDRRRDQATFERFKTYRHLVYVYRDRRA